jgi:DNA-binding response OmpR family regulator
MRIAILEDESDQMEHLVRSLEHHLVLGDESVVCVRFDRGEPLRLALRRETFDLLVLDWNVPDLDGVDLLRWLRQHQQSAVPVIMLSSRSSERDVAAALSLGADDYLVKPLRPLELAARIKRLLVKQEADVWKPVQRFGAWVFDRASSSVQIEQEGGSQRFELTDRDFRLALALFRNLGRPVSRAYLMESMGLNGDLQSRALDTQIYRLRSRLGLGPSRGLQLQTVYGQGYRLKYFNENDNEPDSEPRE